MKSTKFGLLLAILCSLQSAKALSITAITTPKTDNATSVIALKAQQTQPRTSSIVKGIDVFGTSQITTKQVRQLWGKKIIQMAEAIYIQQKAKLTSINKTRSGAYNL